MTIENIHTRYEKLCVQPSDINEHLPTLKRYAESCNSIFETGVRGCVSSWALCAGLLSANADNTHIPKRMLLNDLNPCDISLFLEETSQVPNLTIEYQWCNNLNLAISSDMSFDLVFIDTWHIYGQLKRELMKFAPITNKYIIMHDTTIDAVHGESLRVGADVQKEAEISGFPIQEITCGLGPAIQEFLQDHPEWILNERYENNNGLTILKRVV